MAKEVTTKPSPRSLETELLGQISDLEKTMGPIPETFCRDATVVAQGAGLWRMGPLDLAAIWYRLGYRAAMGTKREVSMYNQDSIAYVEMLATIPPEQRCYCGWTRIGKIPSCPHCPPGVTLATKNALMCPKCRNAPPATNLAAPIIHAITCQPQADGISLAGEPAGAPEAPQNPTHKPTHGSTP